ncbi:C39 family peptidase [Candidatus Saccharibacteria bacterium]|nr:C39 family peptidase [Candidatus Saccharibacteria bacterium]
MNKAKSPLILALLFLPLFAVFTTIAHPSNSSARQLTKEERKFYAQNNIIFTVPCNTEADCSGDSSSSSSSGGPTGSGSSCRTKLSDRSETAFNFLVGKGYSRNAAAAIVGNLAAESSVTPNYLEGGVTITDPSWKVTNWNLRGQKGFGIAQWTTTERQTKLQAYADENNVPVIALDTQLNFLFNGLDGGAFGNTTVAGLNAVSLEEATFIIYSKYEKPLSSFCTTNDKAGCYNNRKPTSYSELSATETKSAYDATNFRIQCAKLILEDPSGKTLTENSNSGSGSSGNASCPNGCGIQDLKENSQIFSQGSGTNSSYRNVLWKGGGDKDVATSGCSLLAVINAANALGQNNTVESVASWTYQKFKNVETGSWNGTVKPIADHLGLEIANTLFDNVYNTKTVTSVSEKLALIKQALASGMPVIASGAVTEKGTGGYTQCGNRAALHKVDGQTFANQGNCVFTGNGHYVAILGVTADDKLVVANPALGSRSSTGWVFPAENVLKFADIAKSVKLK